VIDLTMYEQAWLDPPPVVGKVASRPPRGVGRICEHVCEINIS
jgi:hypothetical protein